MDPSPNNNNSKSLCEQDPMKSEIPESFMICHSDDGKSNVPKQKETKVQL